MTNTNKTVDYYKRLPYKIRVEPMTDNDGNQYWIADIPDLRGCKTDGITRAEAIVNLHELFDEYIEARLEVDSDIPEPIRSPEPVAEPMYLIIPYSPIKDKRKKKVREHSHETLGNYSYAPLSIS